MPTAQGARLAVRGESRAAPLPTSDALLLVLFSFLSPSFFTYFLKTEMDPLRGLLPTLAFEFEAFLHLPSVNASNSPCILLEFSLRQLQFALQDEFGEVNRGTGHITHAGNTIG